MPFNGQTTLLSFVSQGGGFIGHEYTAYQISQGQMSQMIDLTPLERTSGLTGSIVISPVAAQSTHPILASVSGSMSLPSASVNMGSARSYSVHPATVLMTDNFGSDALVVREYAPGRVVQFHHAANRNNSAILSDPALQDIYVDAVTWAAGNCDVDGDGFDSNAGGCGGTDCDDGDASINPAAMESCDSIDQDCDGDLLESFADTDGDLDPDCIDPDDDNDGDLDGADCAPLDPTINSGAVELCNGVDDDCNGQIDEVDVDGDGWSGCGDDCNDTNNQVNPGQSEVENGVDDDCDGEIDEGFGGDDDDATGDDDDATGDDDDATGDDDDATGDDDDATGDDDDATGDDDDSGDDDDVGDDDAGDDDDGGGGRSGGAQCSQLEGAPAAWALVLGLASIARRRERRTRPRSVPTL